MAHKIHFIDCTLTCDDCWNEDRSLSWCLDFPHRNGKEHFVLVPSLNLDSLQSITVDLHKHGYGTDEVDPRLHAVAGVIYGIVQSELYQKEQQPDPETRCPRCGCPRPDECKDCGHRFS